MDYYEEYAHGGTYKGKQDVFEEYFPKLLLNFKEFHVITDEFLDAGNAVIVLGKYQIVSKNTGESFESPFVHIYTIKDGKIRYC